SRLAPGEFYGVTKHCSEQVLESYTAYFDLSLLRLFVPYGPGQRGRMIPNIAKAVREGRPVVLVNGGHPYVNPVFIDDVVAVMRQALRRPGTHVLNVAGPESISVREIATIAGTLVGREPVFEEGSEAPASDLLADITALRSRFAIPDLVGPVEGIRRLLEADDLHDRREAPPLLGRGEMCPARVS
ncbi:MAG: NAD-dependent epimerase/dehydratase family protein, partial [Nitrospira sp.]